MNEILSAINSSTSQPVFRWDPAAWLRVAGPDAATFLQGQFTNDLRALERRSEVYGLWLTVKGKVLADSFVLRGTGEGEFWVGSYFSRAEAIRERLESHIIADDVTVEDLTSEWTGVSWLGDEPAPAMAPTMGGVQFQGRRRAGGNLEWVFPRSQSDAVRASLAKRRELTPEDVARLRIAAGIPAIPADVGPADLPNEAGLEADAISFTKGCYLGQEVMARLKAMGQVRRRLMRVRGDDARPTSLPLPLFNGARQVGELRSAVGDGGSGWSGLAMLSLLHVSAGATLALAPSAPPAVHLVDLP